MLKYVQLINPILNVAIALLWAWIIYSGTRVDAWAWTVMCLHLLTAAVTSYVAWLAWGTRP